MKTAIDSDPRIEAQASKVDGLRRELELEEAKLAGMRLMQIPASLATHEPRIKTDTDGQSIPAAGKGMRIARAGRQPGAISHQWRNILGMLYMAYPDGFTEYNVVTAAKSEGLENLRPKDALDRLRNYMTHGYTEYAGDKFVVTEFAAQKYDFRRHKIEAAAEGTAAASKEFGRG